MSAVAVAGLVPGSCLVASIDPRFVFQVAVFPPQPWGACSCLSWDPLCLPLLPLVLHFNLALATGKPSRTGRRWSRRCW